MRERMSPSLCDPPDRCTRAWTSAPTETRRRARCDPMNPAAPVMRTDRPERSSTGTALFHYSRLRDRDDESPAPPPILVLLLHDLVGEVPRQDQQIVGHGFQDSLRRHYWDQHPWRVLSLLEPVAVGEEVEGVRPDPAVVEESVPLRGRSVASQPPALPLEVAQERHQPGSEPAEPVGEVVVGLPLEETVRPLAVEPLLHRRHLAPVTGVPLRIDAHRPSVDREEL